MLQNLVENWLTADLEDALSQGHTLEGQDLLGPIFRIWLKRIVLAIQL